MAKMLDWRRKPGTASLLDMFRHGVAQHPDRAFTIFNGETLTWGAAARAVAGAAERLTPDTDIALVIPSSLNRYMRHSRRVLDVCNSSQTERS